MKISEPGENGRRVLTTVLVVIGLLLSMGAVAHAQDEEADREYWVNRYETLVTELEDARARVELSQLNYTRSITRNYPRGEVRLELAAERDEAIKDLAKIEAEFEAFPDEARRAGALPGWFRDLD